ncbi:hypothetical protein GCM10011360_11170 [Primorskyibacter flagellatus]|uniref:Pentapeptide repeat-containing protein n=1 Tax=Primorskyibacter flagellatus TaxID=1387277 RepID=A0A917A3D0_9RHOB|nr:hypothetical protein [Primorskyibacter flagellatus]GGE24499.1 hypothetical protein GCM10011360_11170 [Primorskyibacter flagellatus]
MIPSLSEDCGQCAALCCLALAFDRGNSFGIDKPAGVPCPNLSGHACSIHDRLESEGFSGCVRYSCTGAGQRVVQELFAGRSWQDDPALTAPMMEAFRGMREIQERLAQLSAAQGLALSEEDAAEAEALIGALVPRAVTTESVIAFPGSPLSARIDGFVRSLRRYVTA